MTRDIDKETKQAQRIGREIADVMQMKRDREHPDMWRTSWGTKTDLGVYLVVTRIIREEERWTTN